MGKLDAKTEKAGKVDLFFYKYDILNVYDKIPKNFRKDQGRHWPENVPHTLVFNFVKFKRGDDKEKSQILEDMAEILEETKQLKEHFGYKVVLISFMASLFLETGNYNESERYLSKFENFRETHSKHFTYESEINVCKAYAQFQCAEFSMNLIQLSDISAAYREEMKR